MIIPHEDLEIKLARPVSTHGMQIGTGGGVIMRHKPTGIAVLVDLNRGGHWDRYIAMDAILGALTSPSMKETIQEPQPQDLNQVREQFEFGPSIGYVCLKHSRNTIIQWTIYDETKGTRPHSLRCCRDMDTTKKRKTALNQRFLIKPRDESMQAQAFFLHTKGEWGDHDKWIFENWVWVGEFGREYPLQVGDAWAPWPVFLGEKMESKP